jgi:signal transduction histidine kinase
MIFELHSPVLDTEGLHAAIEVYADETFGDSVAWSIHGDPGDLSGATAGLAYRLAREALFNIYKHAHASVVEIVIDRSPSEITVSVRDDGRGFDAAEASSRPGHLGLGQARQLANAAGGTWSCTSAPGSGTTVRFTLPVTSDAAGPTTSSLPA